MDLASISWETLASVGGPLAVLCFIVYKKLEVMSEALVKGLDKVAEKMSEDVKYRHEIDRLKIESLAVLDERTKLILMKLEGLQPATLPEPEAKVASG